MGYALFKEDAMSLAGLAKAILACAAVFAMTRAAAAQNLTLDDFSSGPYEKQLRSGQDLATQNGNMVGGERLTAFTVCQSQPCGLQNPFSQAAAFRIRAKTNLTPSALIHSSGYKAFPRLDVNYGSNAPLQLNLGQYDRLRVTFDGIDLLLNFNILAFSPSGYSQTGCSLEPSILPVSIDFPFVDFQGTADFTKIDGLDFIFQSGSAIGANDWAVTSFEAVPIGDPPAQRICHGL